MELIKKTICIFCILQTQTGLLQRPVLTPLSRYDKGWNCFKVLDPAFWLIKHGNRSGTPVNTMMPGDLAKRVIEVLPAAIIVYFYPISRHLNYAP
jgi:hypothetical protein